jgi:imidazole glycerol-phosphate synthase subunit HisH
MNIAIVKYNAGNTQSVIYALERLGVEATVTDDIAILQSADKVIFPGVGAARSAMDSLQEKKLDLVIKSLKQPVLGICVGMQLLFEYSEENQTPCLGIIPAQVKLFTPISDTNTNYKVPQIGWNTINGLSTNLFNNISDNSYVYYVHSYYGELNPFSIANTNHGLSYSAAVKKDNFYGVQFHTEKSGTVGSKILDNFLKYC